MPTAREIPLRGEQVDYTKNESEAIVPRHPRHVHMFTADDERRYKRGMDDETPRRAHPSSLTHNLQIVGHNL